MTHPHCQRCEELEEQLHQMFQIVSELRTWCAPKELGLTAHQECILATLLRWDRVVSSEAIWQVTRLASGAKSDAFGDPCNTIKAHVSRLRTKLRPHGLEIDVSWGRGYFLPPDTRRRLANWDRERAAA